MNEYLIAAFLGIVEGITEFLPISSTGHLILFIDLLKFNAPEGRVFEVMIQLGAMLAVITVFYKKIFSTAFHIHNDEKARHFAICVIVGFIPAMILGATFHSQIKALLFDPFIVACTLIIGGIIFIIIDRISFKENVTSVDNISIKNSFLIGCFQTIAMIPGVSRSGATIVGGVILGLNKKTAAEFSFFLGLPTMAGAFAYDAYKNWNLLDFNDITLIIIGFTTAFLSALVIVKPFIKFISSHGFTPFGIYRILLGSAVILVLFLA